MYFHKIIAAFLLINILVKIFNKKNLFVSKLDFFLLKKKEKIKTYFEFLS